MHKGSKRIMSLVLILTFTLLSFPSFAEESKNINFSDVPDGHWSYQDVRALKELKITDGIGNNKFGLGLTIKRSEFVAYLVKLMKWDLIKPTKGSFSDNMKNSKWYYPYIETALHHSVIPKNPVIFRPEEPITREEMAIMIVNTLGYETLAKQVSHLGTTFRDVSKNTGHIMIAKDFSIISGVGNNMFMPDATAKREEAASMMMRMHKRLNQPINELHAFYAISSYGQMNMISSLDSVSFGWSRMEFDEIKRRVVLNTSNGSENVFAIPKGFSEPVRFAQKNKVSTQLMVFADSNTLTYLEPEKKISLLELILKDLELRKQAVLSIVEKVTSADKDEITVSFDGVVIDFESMKGEELKQSFNEFLNELKLELGKTTKKLYVAVHPKTLRGSEHYDAYDYKTIGEIADKVILMAHDYYAKTLTDDDMKNGYTSTPLSPIDEVYYAIKALSDSDTGVQDKRKIWLQISFDVVQWKLKDGKIINQSPIKPNYKTLWQRLVSDGDIHYSELYKNPYTTFFDIMDETDNIVWYEDSRSVQDKINLSKMFGINGISLWRLGNVPDYQETDTKKIYLDTWQQIQKNIEK